MSKDEALRLALKAMVVNNQAWKYLADSGDAGNFDAEEQGYYQLNEQAITAVEAALEAKVEPVAWYLQGLNQRGVSLKKETQEWKPLYTTPPQRKPLTIDAIIELAQEIDWPAGAYIDFARAIELAHGIKDNT